MEATSFAAFLVKKWLSGSEPLSSRETANQLIALVNQLTEELPAEDAAPFIKRILVHWDEHPGIEDLRRHSRWQDLTTQSLARLEETLPVETRGSTLPQLTSLRASLEMLANRPQWLEGFLHGESSLWLEGKLSLQTRIPPSGLRELRSKYRKSTKPENELVGVEIERPIVLPDSDVRLGELMSTFMEGKRDLLSFLIEEAKNFGVEESEIPAVFLQLVQEHPSQIDIKTDLIVWRARSWAKVLPMNKPA